MNDEPCTRVHVDPDSQHLLDIIERQQRELKEARVVIGAAALTAGGFLRVSRKAITEIDLDGELSSWGEPDAIVFTYHPRYSP